VNNCSSFRVIMVVQLSRDNNLVVIDYRMMDAPPRMRASNSVRRYELLQLEEETQHLYEELVDEIVETCQLTLTPEGIKELKTKFEDLDDTSKATFVLHTDHGNKCKGLSLSKYIWLSTKFKVHHISCHFTVLTETSIKFEIKPYITRYYG